MPGAMGQANDQANDNEPGAKSSAGDQSNRNAATTQQKASGQGAAADQQSATQVKGAKLNARQVTKVRQTVFASRNVPRVRNVDFAIDVGTRVPTHVHVVAVPSSLVTIYPEWRGHEYFVARDEIVILDHSRNIVAVVPAGSNRASVGRSSTSISVSNLSEPEIREIQTVLVQRGVYHGHVDGVFGPQTRDALIVFQRNEGLQATGEINTRTVSSLGLSSKINVESQGASTTGQGSGSNASSQGQMNNNAAQQNDNQSSAEKNMPQSQSQSTPNERSSTTGQGSQAPDAQQKDRSMPNAKSEDHQSSPAMSGQGGEPNDNGSKTDNMKQQ
jgi:peptidoglycan hydrolase-like protein with peptidoglycan-binding domain